MSSEKRERGRGKIKQRAIINQPEAGNTRSCFFGITCLRRRANNGLQLELFLSLAIPNLTWITQDAFSHSRQQVKEQLTILNPQSLPLFFPFSFFYSLSLSLSLLRLVALFSLSALHLSPDRELLSTWCEAFSLSQSLSLFACLFHLVFSSSSTSPSPSSLSSFVLAEITPRLSGCRRMHLCDLAWCQLAKYLPSAT